MASTHPILTSESAPHRKQIRKFRWDQSPGVLASISGIPLVKQLDSDVRHYIFVSEGKITHAVQSFCCILGTVPQPQREIREASYAFVGPGSGRSLRSQSACSPGRAE